MEVWKEFENNEITHSAAHHLMAISHLLNKNGYARVTDVAKRLNITRGSASITLKALKERGLVVEDENKFLRLSEEGESIAHLVRSKRRILIKFFRDVLGVDAVKAEIDACKIEHLISFETGEKLLSFVKFLFANEEMGKQFLKTFRNFHVECPERDDCPICRGDCLLEDSDREPVHIQSYRA